MKGKERKGKERKGKEKGKKERGKEEKRKANLFQQMAAILASRSRKEGRKEKQRKVTVGMISFLLILK